MKLIIDDTILSTYSAVTPINSVSVRCGLCPLRTPYGGCYHYRRVDYRGWNHLICDCCTGWKMEGYY